MMDLKTYGYTEIEAIHHGLLPGRVTELRRERLKVQAIRELDSRWRHTTTYRQLFMLPSGAMIIDTPGMRELGLFDAKEGIAASFTDVEEWFPQPFYRLQPSSRTGLFRSCCTC